MSDFGRTIAVEANLIQLEFAKLFRQPPSLTLPAGNRTDRCTPNFPKRPGQNPTLQRTMSSTTPWIGSYPLFYFPRYSGSPFSRKLATPSRASAVVADHAPALPSRAA